MDIVVRGRNVEVPDHYRQHVADKLARIERYDQHILRADVELYHEKNPRQSDICQRVEITCRVKGPITRAEACAADFYKALDLAVERLERRFRQAADRRRIHHGRHTPKSVAVATGALVETLSPGGLAVAEAIEDDSAGGPDGPGQVVREKEHPAKPMTIDQALFEMELVGHDFYLFADADSGRPSVVYRRHGYDYGVIRLVE
ncbi:MAG: ribosome hibernation-promoting factor, HPF/YfiA family [Jatrophihabitantaceae bacterium]